MIGCSSNTDGVVCRVAFALAAISSLVVFVVLSYPLFSSHVYLTGDLGLLHVPIRHFYAECLQNGDSFLWCPYLRGGYYLHGGGEAGMFHPLHFLLYRFLPFSAAFNIEFLLPYPLMLGGFFILLKKLNIKPAAAFCGGALAAFCGFNMLHHIHMQAVMVIAHLPWILLLMKKAADAKCLRSRLLCACGLALLFASQILLFHPQSFFILSLFEIVFAVVLVKSVREFLRLGLFWLGAKIIGIVLGAVQVYPALDVYLLSERMSRGIDFLSEYSLPPENLAQLFNPYLFVNRYWQADGALGSIHEFGIYCGAFALSFIVFCLLSFKSFSREKRAIVAVCVSVFVVGLLLAFGKHNPLYPLLMKLPVVNMFRCPVRYVLLSQISTAFLAALALDEMLDGSGDKDAGRFGKAVLCFVPGFVALMVAVAALVSQIRDMPWLSGYAALLSSQKMILCGLAVVLFASLIVAVSVMSRRSRMVAAAIVVLAIADAGYYGLSFVRGGHVADLKKVVCDNPFEREEGWFRVHGGSLDNGTHAPNIFMLQGASLVNGYTGGALAPVRVLDYRRELQLRMAGLRWVSGGRGNVWVNIKNPFPRAWMVGKIVQGEEINEIILKHNPALVAVVDNVGAVDVSGKTVVPKVVEDRPGKIRLQCKNKSAKFLVLSENYHHGWRVYVDCVEADVHRAFGDFLGCVVPPGTSEVMFEFKPTSYRRGLWISIIALVALSGLAASCLLRRRCG